jgi:hypothetical protein
LLKLDELADPTIRIWLRKQFRDPLEQNAPIYSCGWLPVPVTINVISLRRVDAVRLGPWRLWVWRRAFMSIKA